MITYFASRAILQTLSHNEFCKIKSKNIQKFNKKYSLMVPYIGKKFKIVLITYQLIMTITTTTIKYLLNQNVEQM